jgi:hypothetical protein
MPMTAHADDCASIEAALNGTCLQGSESKFDGFGVETGLGRGPTTGTTPVGNGGNGATVRVVTAVAPICQGNTPGDTTTVCSAALLACADDGDIAYWVWHQEVRAGEAVDPAAWVKVLDPPYVCRGPTEPVVSPREAVAAVVDREFASYGITRGRLMVDPEGTTLVGFRTRFWTDAEEYGFTRTILGRQVRITATPQRYVFHFGDGSTATRDGDAAPRKGTDDLVHVYRRSGSKAAHVEVTWSGTYVIEGSPEVLTVRGTATTTGPATAVEVREARSQYESG